MAEFAAADSYRRFEQTVKHKTRYFHDRQVRTFLDTVLETSQSRKESIKEFSVLFRAQRGYTWRKDNEGEPEEMEVPAAFPPERMKPRWPREPERHSVLISRIQPGYGNRGSAPLGRFDYFTGTIPHQT